MKTNLNDLAKHCHNEAKQKGWYDKERPVTELLMLTVCEISEAVEADRKQKHCEVSQDDFKRLVKNYMEQMEYSGVEAKPITVENSVFQNHIKDTFQDEIADTMIRLLDLVGYMDIDIDFHIQKKLQYNQSRPQKHGKAY